MICKKMAAHRRTGSHLTKSVWLPSVGVVYSLQFSNPTLFSTSCSNPFFFFEGRTEMLRARRAGGLVSVFFRRAQFSFAVDSLSLCTRFAPSESSDGIANLIDRDGREH